MGRARDRAEKLYPRSTHFQNAYLAGVESATAGKDASHCPYRNDPRKTWRQAYRIAWLSGHASVWEPGE